MDRTQISELIEADPVAIIDLAAAIAHGEGGWPTDDVSQGAADLAGRIETANMGRVRAAVERMLMGREVDHGLEWLQQVGVVRLLFPELAATVDLVQEEGR